VKSILKTANPKMIQSTSAESCKNLVARSTMDEYGPAPYQLTVGEADLPGWDAFLARTPGGSYQQTSSWSIAKLAQGFRARRFTIKSGDTILGGAQLLYRPLPFRGVVGYVPLGPVLASDDPEVVNLAVAHLHRIAGEQKVSYLVVQTPHGGHAFARRLQSLGFLPALLELAPSASVVIDLSNSLDFIMAKMSETTRHAIRTSEHRDITVREGRLEDLDVVHKLLQASAKRRAFPTLKKGYLSEVWRQFSRSENINVFIAEFEGTTVSAALIMACGETVTYWKGGWSGEQYSCFPNEALQWAAIKWAKSRGYRYYDLGGINRALATSALADQVTRPGKRSDSVHKLGFGGQIELFPEALVYVYNPTFRRVWAAISTREREQAFLRNILDRSH
jgi:lipid II:glycine glycyltransferase (peptidoglycan interpeptide bridge formation enzyme)